VELRREVETTLLPDTIEMAFREMRLAVAGNSIELWLHSRIECGVAHGARIQRLKL
jgi:hypothetical protein